MKIRFQKPWYHHKCYECPGAWELRWPIVRQRKYEGSPEVPSAIINEFSLLNSVPVFSKAALIHIGQDGNVVNYNRLVSTSVAGAGSESPDVEKP